MTVHDPQPVQSVQFAPLRAPQVLVVEDDPEINELVGAYVQLLGLGYLSAGTGSEAMRQLTEHHPALVILDVMLPDADGFEICRSIRHRECLHGGG